MYVDTYGMEGKKDRQEKEGELTDCLIMNKYYLLKISEFSTHRKHLEPIQMSSLGSESKRVQCEAQTKPIFVFHSIIIGMMWLVKIYTLHIHGKPEGSKHTLNHIQI